MDTNTKYSKFCCYAKESLKLCHALQNNPGAMIIRKIGGIVIPQFEQQLYDVAVKECSCVDISNPKHNVHAIICVLNILTVLGAHFHSVKLVMQTGPTVSIWT